MSPPADNNRYYTGRQLYNELPDIATASRLLPTLENLILPELLQLLLEYGLSDCLAICLVHRHFTLNYDTEQVVDLTDGYGNMVVSSVFNNGAPNSEVIADYELKVPPAPSIVGTSFLIRDTLVPYQFSCMDVATAEQYTDVVSNIQSDFLVKWKEVVEKYNLGDGLGLHITPPDVKKLGMGYETFDMGRRLLLTVYDSSRKEHMSYIPTAWVVEMGGMANATEGCDCGD